MNQYRLELTDRAKQQIKLGLPEHLRAEIVQSVLGLRDDPKPANSELQRELRGRYRLKIDEKGKVVTVLEVRPRNRNTYLNVP